MRTAGSRRWVHAARGGDDGTEVRPHEEERQPERVASGALQCESLAVVDLVEARHQAALAEAELVQRVGHRDGELGEAAREAPVQDQRGRHEGHDAERRPPGRAEQVSQPTAVLEREGDRGQQPPHERVVGAGEEHPAEEGAGGHQPESGAGADAGQGVADEEQAEPEGEEVVQVHAALHGQDRRHEEEAGRHGREGPVPEQLVHEAPGADDGQARPPGHAPGPCCRGGPRGAGPGASPACTGRRGCRPGRRSATAGTGPGGHRRRWRAGRRGARRRATGTRARRGSTTGPGTPGAAPPATARTRPAPGWGGPSGT